MGPKAPVMLHPSSIRCRTYRPCRAFAARALVFILILTGSAALPASALALDAPDRFEPAADPARHEASEGLGILQLPLGFQARFETNYTRYRSLSDRLASRFVGRYEALTGPGPLRERALESRFSLSHPLWEKVDLELAWETRNRIAVNEPMQIERHTIGALIRFTP